MLSRFDQVVVFAEQIAADGLSQPRIELLGSRKTHQRRPVTLSLGSWRLQVSATIARKLRLDAMYLFSPLPILAVLTRLDARGDDFGHGAVGKPFTNFVLR